MKLKLTISQIDRALQALNYFSTRNVANKAGDGAVPSPCAFSGPITWDLAKNESMLLAAQTAHQKAGRALLQKYVAQNVEVNDARKPHMPYVMEQANHNDAEYEVDIVQIPADALDIENNKIPGSFLSAISFMIEREAAPAKPKPVKAA